MGRRQIVYQGKQIVGTDVGYRIVQDGSVRLELEDGAVLVLRPVVVNVVKTEEKTPEGDRIYIVQNLVNMNLELPAKEDRE